VGTSFGASHVLTAAARHPELAAAVVQCPILRGRAPALVSGWRTLARLAWPIASDLLRVATGSARRYVQIAGRPGDLAFVTIPGAFEGWHAAAQGSATFDNRVAAASGLGLLTYDASRRAPHIRCPLLVCVSDHEDLMDPALAVKVAQQAPHGQAIHYPADHFQVYFPPLSDQIVADQVGFLRHHLKADTPDPTSGVA
jgi:pimeloyl-ACP methyl ester carboxylesterase